MYEIYTVSDTDNLSTIAKKYGTTEEILSQINGFDKNYVLRPQTEIIVPVATDKTYKYYTVKKGDNLYQIAKTYNVDYDLLLKLNGLDKEDYIYPNQTLLLPKSGLTVYLTKEGDTIGDILDNLNTNIDELLKENKNIYLAKDQIMIFKEK